jgi:glycosyltransferase involved in cell wall biosynthesis
MHNKWDLGTGIPNLVSVVVPAYSRYELLVETLLSVKSQTYAFIECIIVDDGSPEGLLPKIEAWIEKNGGESISWRAFRQKNCGGSAARNSGAKLSKGEYIQFLDSDDVLKPTAIEKAVGAARTGKSRIGYFQVQVTNADLTPQKNLVYGSPAQKNSNFYFDYSWHTMGAIYHRSLLTESGPWNEQVSGNDDWEFQVRAKLKENDPAFINEILGYYRDHQDQRLSVKAYDRKWMTDLIKVFDSIISNLRAEERLDGNLKNRLAKRALIHAVESGANGDKQQKRAFCQIAKNIGPSKPQVRILQLAISCTPGKSALKLFYYTYTRFLIKPVIT